MTSGIGIVGPSTGVVTPQVAVAHTVASNSGNFASTLSSTATSSSTTSSVDTHSSRVVQDPAVGLITQYLSANGSQIVSQTPSAITVAYLRVGLNADGLPRSSTRSPVSTSV